MPELPEVETVARDLKPRLLGKWVSEVWWSGKKMRLPWETKWGSAIRGYRFVEVSRRAKWLVFTLEKNASKGGLAQLHLVGHLGMTGQLTFQADDYAPNLPQDHVHLVFQLRDQRGAGRAKPENSGAKKIPSLKGVLRYRDIRRFGGFQLVRSGKELESFFREHKVGPEPWDCSPDHWFGALQKTKRFIKAVLLDQTLISGVGNIYADECLHSSGIHPLRRGDSLTRGEAGKLLSQAAAVMRAAIQNRGTTIRNYVGGENLNGENQQYLQVYGRAGEPCFRCGDEILRVVVGGRSSHFCPKCQKGPELNNNGFPGGSN